MQYRAMVQVLEKPPDIISYSNPSKQNNFNPVLYAPNDAEEISFWETKESMNTEIYKKFLDNSVSRFRKSVTYKSYKEYLYELGLDRCQVLGLNKDIVTLELHHNFLTVYDIAYIITEHILNTIGYVNTFLVVRELKRVHTENKVPIVMISKTVHQLYHANKEFILPGKMCFGFWTELIKEFSKGLSLDISYKILNYINESLLYKDGIYKDTPDMELLTLRDQIKEWSEYNEYIVNYPTNKFINMVDSGYSNQYYLNLYNQTYSLPFNQY